MMPIADEMDMVFHDVLRLLYWRRRSSGTVSTEDLGVADDFIGVVRLPLGR